MSKKSKFLSDLKKLGFKELRTLFLLLEAQIKGKQDDRKYLLENLIKLLAKWDEGSVLGDKLTNAFIGNLWNTLEHPPATSLGAQYRYRAADGSFNNIAIPDLGRAGTPYARCAKPVKLQNIALPDPGVIFDNLLAREDTFDPHPNRISSMLFYLASIIIHDIFRTDHHDFNISKASSYLDLAPLYGSNQNEQDTVRTFKDGKLKPDCFSEKRVLGFPPGVGVILIMFNRFHNYVVMQLARINENQRFCKPTDSDTENAWVKYDNDLFQTGRLITCGLYVNCILKDYVRTILNLNRTDSKWNLDPRTEEGKSLFDKPVAEGVGNQVAAEFNLIYRWHSVISERDDQWTQNLYNQLLPGKKNDEVFVEEFLDSLSQFQAKIPTDPLKRNFANLTRDSNGTFPDDDLVSILETSVCDVASSFGANRIPKILRSVEILGIVQSRSWNMASLNEFREASGLSRHKTFKDINPDPIVCKKLQGLYDHPDCVELYTGLMVEKSKPPISPGSGLCVNFTTSYSILADAVSLVRGDRFYTTDYTAKSLTNWGFNEVQYNTSVNQGCVISKLILRAFPHHFSDNSIYAHFPFVIPEENLIIQKSLNRAKDFSWEKPKRIPDPVIVRAHDTIQKILRDQLNWKLIGNQNASFLTNRPGNEFDRNSNMIQETQPLKKSKYWPQFTLPLNNLRAEIKNFYQENITDLLKENAFEFPDINVNQVDIVRDISNLVNARFAASVFNLPLKKDRNSGETFTVQEIYEKLSLLYLDLIHNNDVALGFELHQSARESNHRLGKQVASYLNQMTSSSIPAQMKSRLEHKGTVISSYGNSLVLRMLEAEIPIKEIVWNHILPTAASMAVGASQVFCQALDFYLGEGAKFLPDLFTCSHSGTEEADEKLERYFLEGARLSSINGLYRIYQPKSDTANLTTSIQDDHENYSISTGQFVFVDLPTACRDSKIFPNPDEVILTRPIDSYLDCGFGFYQSMNGQNLNNIVMTAMFKSIFGLKGLRRAQGSGKNGRWVWGESQGELKKVEISPLPLSFTADDHHPFSSYMTPDQSRFRPFPTTMKIQWERD